MDLSIIYKVLYRPKEVFAKYLRQDGMAPIIFIAVLTALLILKYFLQNLDSLISRPVISIVLMVPVFSIFLLFPIINAILYFLFDRLGIKTKIKFITLLGVFVLCQLPQSIELMIGLLFNIFFPISVGRLLFDSIEKTSPLLFQILGSIRPTILWSLVLWWIATKALFNLKQQYTLLSVGFLFLLNIFIQGGLNYLVPWFINSVAH